MDEKFEELRARAPARFQCGLGCHACCKPGLTVSAVERARLAAYLRAHPTVAEQARALEQENPHGGERCRFLARDGACLVYEARPLVCRSHGAPLQVTPLGHTEENVRVRDVCPLNFRGVSLAGLPASEVLNVDTLNTLLALLNRLEHPGNEERTPLSVHAILADGP